MPANLTPDYLAAEARFKAERDPKKRIEALEEMLGVIPKHKGTEHLRGDLKKRLSQLREELGGGAKKGGVRRVSPGNVPAQGAGRVLLLGPTNTGKSSLVRALTRAEPEVAPYPYTTRKPLPAMMMYEDASIQLVDAPALDRTIYEPWMNTLVRNADLGLVVLDPAAPDILGAIDEIQEVLAPSRLKLTAAWWAVGKNESAHVNGEDDIAGKELDDAALLARLEPGDAQLPVVVVVNQIDIGDNRAQFEVLQELFGNAWPLIATSAPTGEGLDRLSEVAFRGLRVIRVYAKPPGKPPSTKEPVILPAGSTVKDMARHIHKDLESKLRFARVWGERYHDGQRIPRDAVLMDRDIVELNA